MLDISASYLVSNPIYLAILLSFIVFTFDFNGRTLFDNDYNAFSDHVVNTTAWCMLTAAFPLLLESTVELFRALYEFNGSFVHIHPIVVKSAPLFSHILSCLFVIGANLFPNPQDILVSIVTIQWILTAVSFLTQLRENNADESDLFSIRYIYLICGLAFLRGLFAKLFYIQAVDAFETAYTVVTSLAIFLIFLKLLQYIWVKVRKFRRSGIAADKIWHYITPEEYTSIKLWVMFWAALIGRVAAASITNETRLHLHCKSSEYIISMLSTFLVTIYGVVSLPGEAKVTAIDYKSRLHFTTEFVKYVQHELRTPLNTISLNMQLLDSELIPGHTSKEALASINEIKVSCAAVTEILDDLLMYQNIESNSIRLEKAPVAPAHFMKDILNDMSPISRNSKVELVGHIETHLSAPGFALDVDAKKLKHALHNILANSIRASTPNSRMDITAFSAVEQVKPVISNPFRRRAVVVAPLEQSQKASMIIIIRDNVPMDGRVLVLDDVVRLEATPNSVDGVKSNSMSLWVTKKIVELHGGDIKVRTRGDKMGWAIHIRLPLHYDENIIEAAESRFRRYDSSVSDVLEGPASSHQSFRMITNVSQQSKVSSGFSRLEIPAAGYARAATHGSLVSVSNVLYPDFHRGSAYVEVQSGLSVPVRPSLDSADSSLHADFSRDSAYGEVLSSLSLPARGQGDSMGSWSGSNFAVSGESSMQLLLVDDSQPTLRVVNKLMVTKGHNCAVAKHGLEAIEQFKERLQSGAPMFDAVLLDNCMPVMEGPECAQELRRLGYEGIILGVTGHALVEDIARFKESGADDVLLKPLVYGHCMEVLDKIRDEKKRKRTSMSFGLINNEEVLSMSRPQEGHEGDSPDIAPSRSI